MTPGRDKWAILNSVTPGPLRDGTTRVTAMKSRLEILPNAMGGADPSRPRRLQRWLAMRRVRFPRPYDSATGKQWSGFSRASGLGALDEYVKVAVMRWRVVSIRLRTPIECHPAARPRRRFCISSDVQTRTSLPSPSHPEPPDVAERSRVKTRALQ